MPVVFRHGGCSYFFFSNEGDPREPVHIHVRHGEKLAKFWVEPTVELADAYGFSGKELNRISKVVQKNAALIVEQWHEHFGD